MRLAANDSSDSLLDQAIFPALHLIRHEFEPCGRWYESRRRNISACNEDDDDLSDEPVDVEEDDQFLSAAIICDPTKWKDQDHYTLLGLGHLRHRATLKQIKYCYKRKVLLHHPDKKKQAGHKEEDWQNDYFACITKASEVLSDPVKRRSYDSIDPQFDDEVPLVNEENKNNFFKVFGPVVEANARWSNILPVPLLGDESSSFEHVTEFYQFWRNFDSWREFSYLDEEDKEKGSDRDERRWIEKQNKAMRLKRRKEDVARLRRLVENVFNCDPRIKRFKEEEKKKREDEKTAKREVIERRKREEQEKRDAEELVVRLQKEKEDQVLREKAEQEKRERETAKKAVKKERKQLKQTVKDKNAFTDDEDEKIRILQEVERLCEQLSLEELQDMNHHVSTDDHEAAKQYMADKLKLVEQRIEQERQETLKAHRLVVSSEGSAARKAEKEWSDDEIQMLIKAVQLLPAGTRNRWEAVAHFMEEHSRGQIRRNAREVLNQVKNMQKMDSTVKEDANKKAFEKTMQSKTMQSKKADAAAAVMDQPSVCYDGVRGWSAEEQRLLEQAMRTYPKTLDDRWDKIAECVPTRTKKECIARVKELAELVQAKKKAQQAATSSTKK